MQNQIKFQSDRTNRSWDQVLFTVFSKRSQWIRISQISRDPRSGLLNKTLIVSLDTQGGKTPFTGAGCVSRQLCLPFT